MYFLINFIFYLKLCTINVFIALFFVGRIKRKSGRKANEYINLDEFYINSTFIFSCLCSRSNGSDSGQVACMWTALTSERSHKCLAAEDTKMCAPDL